MNRTLLTLVALFILTLTCSADILIYKYAGKEYAYTTGFEVTSAYQGQFIYDPSTTNGAWVGWQTLRGIKRYWVNPTTNFVAVTIGGTKGKTYTLLAEADSTHDDQGGLILNATIYKGVNSTLQVASNRSLTFPRMLSADETQVGNSTTYGQELFQSKASYVFQTKLSQASNDANEAVSDVVDRLAQTLESQGYQRSN